MSFTLLVGSKQTKLDTDLVVKLMEHASSVNLVKLTSSGKNALDFTLAYYLGRVAVTDPTAYFHIIAKDTGYDPLIKHLRERHINVQRHASCSDLSFTWPGKAQPASTATVEKSVAKKAVKKASKKAPGKKVATKKVSSKKAPKKKTPKKDPCLDEWVKKVNANFRDHEQSRPTRVKTLLTKVGDLIKKPADGPEVESVIDELRKLGHLILNEKSAPIYKYQLSLDLEALE